jgi:hypothetical protein
MKIFSKGNRFFNLLKFSKFSIMSLMDEKEHNLTLWLYNNENDYHYVKLVKFKDNISDKQLDNFVRDYSNEFKSRFQHHDFMEHSEILRAIS